MYTPSSPHPAIEPWRWRVIWLMFLATMINYMDRQALGATAEFIEDEFGFKEEGYAWIEFWFGLAYGLFQVPAGFLSDRLHLRWLYAGALLLWSAAGFATGLAQSVVALMTCRIVLGIGEAFNWPCAVGIVRRIMPLESRGLANGIFHGGASIGAVLTPLMVLVVAPEGERWRLVFQLIGALGLVWVVLWFTCLTRPQAEVFAWPPAEGEDSAAGPAEPIGRLFLLRTFWITMAVGVTVNLGWHFYRIWMPRFLVRDLKFSSVGLQWALAGFFLAADLGSMGAGYMTRRLVRAGFSVERSRKFVLLGTSLLCLLSAPAALAMTPWVTLPLLFVVGAAAMGGLPLFFALSQEVAPRHTSLCLGICGATSWVAIAVAQPPIGALVDRIGTFVPSLIVIGFVPLLGALIGLSWPEPDRRSGPGGAFARSGSTPAI
jgi:MFS transporter, ACS family, hexuronate transporter